MDEVEDDDGAGGRHSSDGSVDALGVRCEDEVSGRDGGRRRGERHRRRGWWRGSGRGRREARRGMVGRHRRRKGADPCDIVVAEGAVAYADAAVWCDVRSDGGDGAIDDGASALGLRTPTVASVGGADRVVGAFAGEKRRRWTRWGRGRRLGADG